MNLRDNIKEQYPFLSVIQHGNQEYVGIIINQDTSVISFYDLILVKNTEEKTQLLQLGEIWWWESNHRIPINIFLNSEMEQFTYAIKTFTCKDANVVFGPVVNLTNLVSKRLKRKTIQLVRHR